MDRLDAELVLARWDDARTATEKETARQDMVQLQGELLADLQAELAKLEAEVPVIAEKVCTDSASVRDFGALPWAYQCGLAAVNWTEHYPDADPEWDDIKRRVLAVMAALRALDPSSRWFPPKAADEHPG